MKSLTMPLRRPFCAVLNAREIEARERAELREQRKRGAMMARLAELMAKAERMRRLAS